MASVAPSAAKTPSSSWLMKAATVEGNRSEDGKPKSSWMPRECVRCRCVWQFESPGNTALPRPSITSAPGESATRLVSSMAAIRSSSMISVAS